MGCGASSCKILADECRRGNTYSCTAYFLCGCTNLFLWVQVLAIFLLIKTNNIENNKAPYPVDANGRRPTKGDHVEEDRRFLFLNKSIVGDSPAIKYASTAVETLLTGGSLAAGAAKAAPKIRKIAKALAPGFRRSGRRLGGRIKNKFNLPTGDQSGGAYGAKTSYKFERDSKPLRLKGGGVPPSEETPLLGDENAETSFIEEAPDDTPPERPTGVVEERPESVNSSESDTSPSRTRSGRKYNRKNKASPKHTRSGKRYGGFRRSGRRRLPDTRQVPPPNERPGPSGYRRLATPETAIGKPSLPEGAKTGELPKIPKEPPREPNLRLKVRRRPTLRLTRPDGLRTKLRTAKYDWEKWQTAVKQAREYWNKTKTRTSEPERDTDPGGGGETEDRIPWTRLNKSRKPKPPGAAYFLGDFSHVNFRRRKRKRFTYGL